jgi:hypothetical protein
VTIKYLRRKTSGAPGNGLSTTAKYFRRTASGVAGNRLGTKAMYLRRTMSCAAVSGLDSTNKYLRGAAGIGQGTKIKYLRRTTRQRPGPHDHVPAAQNERRRGKRPGSIPGITDVPLHHKRPRIRLVLSMPPSSISRIALPWSVFRARACMLLSFAHKAILENSQARQCSLV